MAKRRPRAVRCALALAVLAAASLPLAAQTSMRGRVTGPEGQPLPGAVVTVRPLLDDVLRTTVETDAEGRYRMENFNPSRAYRFQVTKQGYRSVVRTVESGLGGTSGDGVLSQDFVLFPQGVDPADKTARLLVMSRSSPAVGPYRKGVRAFERGDWSKARDRLESARDLDPRLAPVHETLALVYHRLGEYDNALEAAGRALELAPWDADCLRIRFEALRSLGRHEEARQTLERLAQVASDRSTAVYFYDNGVTSRLRGDHAAAETHLLTALRLAPEMIEAKEALAKTCVELGKYESALALSAEVLEQRPGDVELLQLRHQAWTELGRRAEAEAALEDLVLHDPGPRTATLLYNRGVAAFNAGDDDSAEVDFRRALELDPRSRLARIGLAEVLLRQERYTECLAATGEIEELWPGDEHARRIAGRARDRMAPR